MKQQIVTVKTTSNNHTRQGSAYMSVNGGSNNMKQKYSTKQLGRGDTTNTANTTNKTTSNTAMAMGVETYQQNF
jgi:hypothetical protein